MIEETEEAEPEFEPNIRVLIYRPGQAPTTETIENTLQAKQALVGGIITTFGVGVPGVLGICHDEGLLLGLPFNRYVNTYVPIVGTFLVVGNAPPQFCSLTDEQIEQVKDHI